MGFDIWGDIHDDPEQAKRLKSAKSASCTPLDVSVSEQRGEFSGSHGIYETTLTSCTCIDFARRKMPCKHIYRLAIELGELRDDAESDLSQVKSPDLSRAEKRAALAEAVRFIESYPENVQRKIHDVIRADIAGKPFFCDDLAVFSDPVNDGILRLSFDYLHFIQMHPQKRTIDALASVSFRFPEDIKQTKKARYEWCLDHADDVGPIAFPSSAFVHPSGVLDVVKRKVNSYLLRKYENEEYWTGDGYVSIPHGAEDVVVVDAFGKIERSLSFPDDEITALLDQYGANRCRKVAE